MTILVHTVVEDVKVRLNNVLTHFFNTVNTTERLINGSPIKFPPAKIYYDIRELSNKNDEIGPIIGIVGVRQSSGETFKCNIGNTHINIERITCIRSVYVKVLNKQPIYNAYNERVNAKKFADETWGLLNAIFKTQGFRFISNDIKIISFSTTPRDVSNDQETLLLGTLDFIVDVNSYVDLTEAWSALA
jgi:hypothetical protein